MIETILIAILIFIGFVYILAILSGNFKVWEFILFSLSFFAMVVVIILIGKFTFGVW